MDEQTKRLACLLLSYRMDAPHVSSPGLEIIEADEYYPEIQWDSIARDMESDHFGDCTNAPITCVRCMAEEVVHEAKWIMERFGPPAPA